MRLVIAMGWALLSGAAMAACTSAPIQPELSDASATAGSTPQAGSQRELPIVPGRAARLFVLAGFDETTCAALNSEISVSQAPEKGDVSFRHGQATTIRSSATGRCLGTKLAGTGIYYTPRAGATGSDSFQVTATMSNGEKITRDFSVDIAG